MRQVLAVGAFRRLLAAYVLNELAWSVGTVALSLLVYRRTGSAIGATGFFLCSQVAPALLSPPLVAKLDRRPPDRLLPSLYALEAVLFGALAWMTTEFSLVPVLVLALLDGLVAIIARAMAAAVRVQVIRPLDLVPEGNAVANTAFAIGFMVGPLIGGAVVVAGGTIAALLANCGLFAVMTVTLMTGGLPRTAESGGPESGRLRAALAHVRRDPGLRVLLTLQGFGMACFTISTPVEVIYAQHTLHAGAGGYGAVLSAWGGGAIFGSLVMARFRRRSAAALLGGSGLALAVGFAGLAAAPSLALALVSAAVAGIGNGIESSAAQIAVQRRAPAQWLALIMSLNQSIMQLAPGVGILAGGVIAAVAGTRVAWVVAGTGSLLFAIGALTLLPSLITGADAGEPPVGSSQRTGDPMDGSGQRPPTATGAAGANPVA